MSNFYSTERRKPERIKAPAMILTRKRSREFEQEIARVRHDEGALFSFEKQPSIIGFNMMESELWRNNSNDLFKNESLFPLNSFNRFDSIGRFDKN